MVVERRFKAVERNEGVKRGNKQKPWQIGLVQRDLLIEVTSSQKECEYSKFC